MEEEKQKIIVSVKELREMLQDAERNATGRNRFALSRHFNSENIVEIAKSQFPRLEAKVAIHFEMERTRRLLIGVAGFCLMVGAALIVFAPQGKEGVSYVVAASLAILSLGAIGVQEFRIRTLGVRIDSGAKAVEQREDD